MIVFSLLPHAEFGPNNHWEDANLFTNVSRNETLFKNAQKLRNIPLLRSESYRKSTDDSDFSEDFRHKTKRARLVGILNIQ